MPTERTIASLRLAGRGLSLNKEQTDTYLAAARAGLIVLETRCDMGMQDNFALGAETTAGLAPVTS